MARWVQRTAWGLAEWLTRLPQTDTVQWWTAALLRFATTGERVVCTRVDLSHWPKETP